MTPPRGNGHGEARQPTGGATDAVLFLQQLRREGPWVIGEGDANGAITKARTFNNAALVTLGLGWISSLSGRANLYVLLNPTDPATAFDRPPAEDDIAAIEYIPFDMDEKDFDGDRAKVEARLATLPEKLKPTFKVDSGHGIQGGFKLKQRLQPTPDNTAKAKIIGKALARMLAGDPVQNINRLIRLPGTINVPTQRKIEKYGYREAVPATLVYFESGRVFDFADFDDIVNRHGDDAPSQATTAPDTGIDWDALPEVDVEELPVGDDIKQLIRTGRTPERDYPDRSRAVYRVACQLAKVGCSAEIIAAVLLDPALAISAHILDQPKDRAQRRAVENVIKKARRAADDFDKSPSGGIFPKSPRNICRALAKLEINLSFDAFAGRELIAGPEGQPERYLDDAAVNAVRLLIEQRFRFLAPKELFFDVVADEARKDSFHPVLDYLDSEAWDGVPRIDHWLSTYAGADDTDYTRAVGALWMIAAVRRVRQPGVKFDEVPVLETPTQGLDKSSALRTLAVRDEWFTDDVPINSDAREAIEQLAGKWIAEIAELKGLRNADIERVKSFISRQVDHARMAYGRKPIEARRQCVFAATTNSGTYLRDMTGNRRFCPVRIQRFDLEALCRDRDQLWAEAAYREARGESIRLDPKLYGVAATEQEQRLIDLPWMELFENALSPFPSGKIKAETCWNLTQVPVDRREQRHNEWLGEALRKLGWTRDKLRFKGQRNPQRGYVKGDKEPEITMDKINWYPRLQQALEGIAEGRIKAADCRMLARYPSWGVAQHQELEEVMGMLGWRRETATNNDSDYVKGAGRTAIDFEQLKKVSNFGAVAAPGAEAAVQEAEARGW
jgi:hypothetical protein